MFQNSKEETEKVVKVYKALNIFFCDLNFNEFSRVFACDTTKEVWNILRITFEENSQIRESKINLCV